MHSVSGMRRTCLGACLWKPGSGAPPIRGFPKAQHNMGVLTFRTGPEEEATAWFEKAAAGGWAPAMFALGDLQEESGDMARASELYEAAARQGDANAQDALGRLAFDAGYRGVVRARPPLVGAGGRAGPCRRSSRLGTIYHEGLGVARDPRAGGVLVPEGGATRTRRRTDDDRRQPAISGSAWRWNRVASVRWLAASRDQGNAHAGAYLERVLGELTPAEKLRLQQE